MKIYKVGSHFSTLIFLYVADDSTEPESAPEDSETAEASENAAESAPAPEAEPEECLECHWPVNQLCVSCFAAFRVIST